MAERIVHLFEPVKVNVEEGQLFTVLLRVNDGILQPRFETAAIRQASQTIVAGLKRLKIRKIPVLDGECADSADSFEHLLRLRRSFAGMG